MYLSYIDLAICQKKSSTAPSSRLPTCEESCRNSLDCNKAWHGAAGDSLGFSIGKC